MSPGDAPLRVALLGATGEADDLRRALAERGHDVRTPPPAPGGARAIEAVLRIRGFTGSLTEVPQALRALGTERFDVAHAFSPAAAHAAQRWRLRTGRPVVYSCREVLDRGRLADRRLRLALLSAAVERSDAVVVATEEARDALRRWMMVEAEVLAPGDGAAHAELYRRLSARG